MAAHLLLDLCSVLTNVHITTPKLPLSTASLVMCAVVQFVLSPLLLWQSFFSTLLSNALYALALGYYHYLNFLGYRCGVSALQSR